MEKEQDRRYEKLYENLLGMASRLHERNKMRIRIGSILLIILPFALELVRRLTDSDKVVFLLVWIFCMFALCGYLIGVEYLDDSIRATVKDMLDEEGMEDSEVYDDLMVEMTDMTEAEKLWASIRKRAGDALPGRMFSNDGSPGGEDAEGMDEEGGEE